MDRREMKIFTTMMRLGSVTAAATALNMAQPSVSKALSLMERRMGFALFDRIQGRLFPTPEAALVMNEATRMEEELSRFDRFLGNVRHLRTGQLRVAATPALAVSLLPLATAIFRRDLPGYGLVLDMCLNHEIDAVVKLGQYDIGFAVIPTADETETMQPLRRGKIVCVLPKAHALAARSFIKWEMIDCSDFIYTTTDARIVDLIAAGIPSFRNRQGSATETNRYMIAVNLVRQGTGITMVDEFTVLGTDRGEFAVRPVEPGLPVTLAVAINPRQLARTAVEPFLNAVTSVLDR